jgi:hypothetical protein
MKSLMTVFFFAGLLATAKTASKDDSHFNTDTKLPTTGHETEDSSRDSSAAYTSSQFNQPCGDDPKKQPVAVNGITLKNVYVAPSGERFAPGRKSDPGARCSTIALKGKNVLGLVMPGTKWKDLGSFTVVPGELVGERKGANYMMLPSRSRTEAPSWVPAPCSLQEEESTQKLGLKKGPESDLAHEVMNLSETSSQESPLRTVPPDASTGDEARFP